MFTRPARPLWYELASSFSALALITLFLCPPSAAHSQSFPTWADSAYALLQADLSRILDDQQTYFSVHGTYATDLKTLGCQSSVGVTIGMNSGGGGVSAAAIHDVLGPTRGCAVYLGEGEVPMFPLSPEEPGVIACTEDFPPEPLADLSADRNGTPVHSPFDVPPTVRQPSRVLEAMERRYPSTLRDSGIGGTAQLRLHICEKGTVLEAVLEESSGYELLDVAALRVASTILFDPARYEGAPVDAWVTIPITFTPGS